LFRAMQQASQMKKDQTIVVCLSGRGDKDAAEIARLRS
jgi:tryptophan synthase beta chain